MELKELKDKYERYYGTDELMDHIFDLKKDLLSSDSYEFMEYQYHLMNNEELTEGERNLIKSFFYSEVVNNRNKEKVIDFLLKKYTNEKNIANKASLLRMLGHLRAPIAKKITIEEIKSQDYNMRYSSIIVLCWIGNNEDLIILNEVMLHDPESKLREFAATAMRQIWYNHKSAKLKITKLINNAIQEENNPEALVGMILTIQTLYNKKLGIKESQYGDVSGDVVKAKEKCIKELDKILKK